MMNFEVIATRDSYNDTAMLKEATYGILFKHPKNFINKILQFLVANDYSGLKQIISKYLNIQN